MIHVKISDAAMQLAQLLEQGIQGEEIVITREDGSSVRLVASEFSAPPVQEYTNEALASMDDCELNHYLC